MHSVKYLKINNFFGGVIIFSQPIPLRGRAETGSHNFVSMYVCLSAVISSSSSSPSSVEEGSSRTCVGAVLRDLSLYDIMSGIR